ncbi:MAG: hypothetical protein ACK5QT_04790 [Oligoflexia bacterium]
MGAGLIRRVALVTLLVSGASPWVVPAHAGACYDFFKRLFVWSIAGSSSDPDLILSFPPGARVQMNQGSVQTTGVVIDHHLHGLTVELGDGSKRHLGTREAQTLIQLGAPISTESVGYRLWALRRQVRLAQKVDLWGGLISSLRSEIAELRKLKVEAQKLYLKQVGERILEDLKIQYGVQDIGFHFNLNGGSIEEYVDGGGIIASRGDVALNYGTGDTNSKIYFFRSSLSNLYEILDEPNPKLLMGGRMGSVLTAFRLDSAYLKHGVAEGGIRNATPISLDFDEDWISKQEVSRWTGKAVGIPAFDFVGLPASVFTYPTQRLVLGRLSRDEQTLLTMRYLERHWREFGR